MAAAASTGLQHKKWQILETNCIHKRKTSDGIRFVNNYKCLHVLGRGRFAKVKLCERIPSSSTSTSSGSGSSSSAAAAAAASTSAGEQSLTLPKTTDNGAKNGLHSVSSCSSSTASTWTDSSVESMSMSSGCSLSGPGDANWPGENLADPSTNDLTPPMDLPPLMPSMMPPMMPTMMATIKTSTPPAPPAPSHDNSTSSTSSTSSSSDSAPPPTNRRFAMKIFSKRFLLKTKEYTSQPHPDGTSRMCCVTALDRVREEIRIMRQLYHRNVVLLFEVLESDQHDKLYLVLEYMEQGPCMVFDGKTRRFTSPITHGVLDEQLAKQHVKDIAHGLRYLHKRRICHRDLKPDNVLLNAKGRAHLSDFGCAKEFADHQQQQKGDPVNEKKKKPAEVLVTDTVGTYQFLAPECCRGDAYDPFQVDVWALGIMLLVFLTGQLPFHAETTNELFEEIRRFDVTKYLQQYHESQEDLMVPSSFSPQATDLLQQILTSDPAQRITLKQVLHHPWLHESASSTPTGQPGDSNS